MTRRPAARTLLAVVAAATLGLTACGGDDSEGEESTSQSSSESSEESESSEDEESSEETESSEGEESPSEEPTSEEPSESAPVESPSPDASAPAVDPSAPSADPSASGPTEGTGLDQALAAELEPMVLAAADVPGGTGQGQTQFIPEAQGQPLHMTLTGLEATGACKTAVDTLNSGERLPSGSQFTITQLASGAQVQVGVVKIDGAEQVAQDVAAISSACNTIEGPGGSASVTSLPSNNGYLMSLQNGGQTAGGFSMGVDAVGPEHAAVVLAVSQQGELKASEVGAVMDAQVQKATSAAPQG
ncbi:hypothetical protein [Kytococcus sedentarius]|uniref:hypothetical protein n=1 Tax=Kytococcus sedentarius TaxID=1276 RepID=UPI0019504002|nr:hypothetical protein [Kytococcus sedentarius]QRO87320.1 hypothetical protein I6J30_11030 [Kytococcus sedentarius]